MITCIGLKSCSERGFLIERFNDGVCDSAIEFELELETHFNSVHSTNVSVGHNNLHCGTDSECLFYWQTGSGEGRVGAGVSMGQILQR